MAVHALSADARLFISRSLTVMANMYVCVYMCVCVCTWVTKTPLRDEETCMAVHALSAFGRLLKHALWHIRRQMRIFHSIMHSTQGYSVKYAETGWVIVHILHDPWLTAWVFSKLRKRSQITVSHWPSAADGSLAGWIKIAWVWDFSKHAGQEGSYLSDTCDLGSYCAQASKIRTNTQPIIGSAYCTL